MGGKKEGKGVVVCAAAVDGAYTTWGVWGHDHDPVETGAMTGTGGGFANVGGRCCMGGAKLVKKMDGGFVVVVVVVVVVVGTLGAGTIVVV
jgi:hypothetical protein